MNGSAKKQSQGNQLSRFIAFVVLAYAAGIVVTQLNTALENVYWIATDGEVRQADGTWSRMQTNDFGQQTGILELRYNIDIDSSEKWRSPIGVIVSGPYSAQISWDGQVIGNKGNIGINAEIEIPGNIDTISFIPATMLEPGQHELGLKISTQHMNYDVDRIIHMIALGPYRVDARRPLRYYATSILLFSGLIFLLVQNFRIGINGGSRMHLGLGIFATFVILNLVAEVSRAVINYPYHYHVYRGTLMWLAAIFAGISLGYLTFVLERAKWVPYVLLGGLIMFFIGRWHSVGGDLQITREFLILSAAPSLIYAVNWFKGRINFLVTLPIFWLACFIAVQLSYTVFLDAFFHLATLIFLASAWFWVYVGQHTPQSASNSLESPNHLIVKSKGREVYVAADEALYLRAEGNFTELMKLDGNLLLHHLRLGEIMNNPPLGFIRVHRSYAVNKSRIKALRAAEGSKYWIELDGADDIPVSRYRVAEIREAMKT